MNDERKTLTINLADAAGGAITPYLSGKERGKQARGMFDLDRFDREENLRVVVKLPEYLKGINSSYSLGLFSESVAHLGSLEAFLEKFQFDGKPEIIGLVLEALRRGIAGPPKLA